MMIATATLPAKGFALHDTNASAVDANEVDPAVLAAACRGDRDAFVEVFRFYDRRVRHIAWQVLGDHQAMEDVLQEAALRAFRGLPSFRGESGAGTWLCRIAYTTSVDHLRRRPREVTVDDTELRVPTGPDPEDAVVARMTLDAAFAALSDEQRIALLLVDREGLDYTTAAEVIGIAPGTVASRLFRARQLLRAALQADDEEVQR
jgi:RNA polymerase sigma-70 factor (ECF subfamily)